MAPHPAAHMLSFATTSVGIWLVLMLAIYWPFLRWISQSPACCMNIEPPELLNWLPVILFAVAWQPAGWLAASHRLRLLRVLVQLASVTAMIWLACLVAFTAYKQVSGSHVDAPELIVILAVLSFLSAFQPVSWLERQRSLARPASPRRPSIPAE